MNPMQSPNTGVGKKLCGYETDSKCPECGGLGYTIDLDFSGEWVEKVSRPCTKCNQLWPAKARGEA